MTKERLAIADRRGGRLRRKSLASGPRMPARCEVVSNLIFISPIHRNQMTQDLFVTQTISLRYYIASKAICSCRTAFDFRIAESHDRMWCITIDSSTSMLCNFVNCFILRDVLEAVTTASWHSFSYGLGFTFGVRLNGRWQCTRL